MEFKLRYFWCRETDTILDKPLGNDVYLITVNYIGGAKEEWNEWGDIV